MKSSILPLRDGDPKVFQGWTIKGLIGEGGQSTIYLAKKDTQTAALKMIRKEFLHNQKSVDRFFTEIKNLELINHPNIAKVLEVDEEGAYLAIEYIEGLNLQDHVAENGPLSFEDWIRVADSLSDAIEYCHSIGIIHKDISPTNIILGPNGPVLIDFGISYLENDPKLTSIEEVVGTFPYMSPEHFGIVRPKEMDNFSFAGTLIYAASGHYPFTGENKSEWRQSILMSHPNFEGLSLIQQELLSPLLFKDFSKRVPLSLFRQAIQSSSEEKILDDTIRKEFLKFGDRAEKELIGTERNLLSQRQIAKKTIFASLVVAALATSFAVIGILKIQDTPTGALGAQTSLPTGAPATGTSGSISGSKSQESPPSSTSKQISSSRDCEAEYDRKGANVIALCSPSASSGDLTSIFYLGVTYFEKQNYKEAIKFYTESLNIFEEASTYCNRALANLKIKNYE